MNKIGEFIGDLIGTILIFVFYLILLAIGLGGALIALGLVWIGLMTVWGWIF